MEVMQCQADLLQIVLALRSCRCFPDLLHGRNQQGDEDRDNRDHDQQFDQGETAAGGRSRARHDALLSRKGMVWRGALRTEAGEACGGGEANLVSNNENKSHLLIISYAVQRHCPA